MKTAHPYLNFNGNTEEAFNFYRSVFGGEFAAVLRFADFGDNTMGLSDEQLTKIAHIALPLGDRLLMGTDIVGQMPPVTMGTNVYVALEPESADEADRLFHALAAGGRVHMEIQRTSWAEKHGSCTDRFGVQWMVDYSGEVVFNGG